MIGPRQTAFRRRRLGVFRGFRRCHRSALPRFQRLAALTLVLLGAEAAGMAPPAEAAIVRGVQEIVWGLFQVPLSTLAGTFSGPPVLGTVFGAASGLVGGVGLVAHGALELAASGVSLAKTVGPFVLPFLL